MSLRASDAVLPSQLFRPFCLFCLVCVACAKERESREPEREGAAPEVAEGTRETQRPEAPPLPPLCPPLGGVCIEGFELVLESSEPWPLGTYFLRVALDRRPPTVCKLAFEPVIGAVTDTCNGEEREFRVTHRYDQETRAITSLGFGDVRRVDLEILVAEDQPPLVEVHHDVVVQKCSYACDRAAPLTVQVQLGGVAEQLADAGSEDAGPGVADAALDAAPSTG